MYKYEMALVVSAKLDDEARAAVVDRAKSYIERGGGVIGKVEEWGNKRLAYEIQKQREGFYYFIPFEAEPTCPAEVERHARIMDHVLRYLIVRRDEEYSEIDPSNQPQSVTAKPATIHGAEAVAEPDGEAADETAEEAVAEAAEEAVAEETAPESAEDVEETAEESEEAAEAAEEAASSEEE